LLLLILRSTKRLGIPWPTPDIYRISRGELYGFSVREFPPH